jgi:NAD(P)-dependent dehydrogenase (short-subunit alcohol dehydrogenase family)
MNPYIDSLFSINNRNVVITGGGGHLCSEMARGLAKAGCNVAVLDLRKEKAEAVAEEISTDFKIKALGYEVDASKKNELQEVCTKISAEFGNIDILINGAGINSSTPFFEITEEEYFNVLNSQITSTFLCCQVFGNSMFKNKKGSIINISSASAGPPLSRAFVYSFSKAGIKNLTQNLGREWAQNGIRVNAIRPGFFPTEWNKKNFITKDRENSILNHTPMNRYGEVSELVGAIIYLASDASSFVTGSELFVDGGFSCMTV